MAQVTALDLNGVMGPIRSFTAKASSVLATNSAQIISIHRFKRTRDDLIIYQPNDGSLVAGHGYGSFSITEPSTATQIIAIHRLGGKRTETVIYQLADGSLVAGLGPS